MFDLTQLKQQSGLPAEVLEQIEQAIRADYPDDDMMFELHLVRVLQALKQRRITLEQILAEPVPA
ncbi:MAG: hypothetical protein FJ009_17285 [Chloroflexi bacterium]|nr:hypothetical protein [Chloroflexota bacterium]